MKDFKVIKDKYFELAKLQITQLNQDPDFYNKISSSEYSAIKDFIFNPKTILELGCGLGRFSIYLNNQLSYSPKFYLADFSEVSEKIKYGWNPGDSKYNNLDLTRSFCEYNNLTNFEIIDLKDYRITTLEKQDLICSFLSVGFHYPIEEYLSDFKYISDNNTLFVFGARKGIYNKEYLSSYFEEINIVQIHDLEIKEEVLIMRGLK